MENSELLVANIGWSPNGWKGFDKEMFKNRKLYQFDYIKNTGFGHELWNFYENFGKNVYFGDIEIKPKSFISGTIFFVSKFVDPQNPSLQKSRFYLVGIYGDAIYEPDGFHTGTRVIDLLPDYAIENIKKIVETGDWKGNNPEKHLQHLDRILKGEEYVAKLVSSKRYSTTFLSIKYNGYIELNPEDLGVDSFGQWKITYQLTPDKADKLLDIAIFRHKRVAKGEVIASEPIRKQAADIASKLKRIRKRIR